MLEKRCPADCHGHSHVNRRDFLKATAITAAGTALLGGCAFAGSSEDIVFKTIMAHGPASKYVPRIKAAFVRRKEEYGMWWPGAVYDGEAAKTKYTDLLNKTAEEKGVKLDLQDEPIFSNEEADAWLVAAEKEQVDGLLLILLDRQQHTWPTAKKAANSAIPSIIYSPLGTSFTTNTIGFAEQTGNVIYSTNDFSQAQYGMQMLKAGAKMKRTRCLVIAGNNERDVKLADTGITLRYISPNHFLSTYRTMENDEELEQMADDYIRKSQKQIGATREDVINGIKSYKVAGKLLEKFECDAISMDCLGALADEPISLPCIAWSRMNDDAIPAACEADPGAIASHILTQYLFDRPGFQQDPVADTSDDTIIGAHCSSPTRLNGFGTDPEPYDLIHHHGNRDAVPRTIWKVGQRITCVDLLPGKEEKKSQLLISAGTVVDNMSVPPSGGCVVSVKAKMDGDQNVLTFPGFHQLFFYGDFKNELGDFSQLCGFEGQIV